MNLSIAQILSATGGRLLCGREETRVTHFITDSRQAGAGAMFVPVRGEKVDGHAFIGAAISAGACAAFTDHPLPPEAGALVLVEDCRAALQRTAAWYREGFDIPIVGITGSVGKTTAKEMVAQALSAGFQVHRTAGNQNSQVGVPITVCGMGPEHTAAVIEMGVSMPGEMERIARVVKPTCAVMTNIGTSHIEFMKTQENILAEKARIAGYLSGAGALFVNGDDPLLAGLPGAVRFGLGKSCQWQGVDLASTPEGQAFTCLGPGGERVPVQLPVAGEHNVRNALAALAVAAHLGVPLENAARALTAYEPPAMRQQMKERRGVTIIDDSYNASPDSMRSSIDVLASRVGGRRIAVLAGMLELGSYSRQGHLDTGRYAKEKGVELLAVGELGREIAEGYGPGAGWASTNQEAADLLKGTLKSGDSVLVKGSRGMRTEEIVAQILAEG